MPPAISDGEQSDVDVAASPDLSARRGGREKKRASSYKAEEEEEEEKKAPIENEEDDDDAEDDQGEEGEEYIVEKILSHAYNKAAKRIEFKVKWEGYDDESELTWEPEEHLIDNASQIFEEYLDSIGGREALLAMSNKALSGKKRGRPSSGTPQASGSAKRSKKNGEHPQDSDAPLTAKATLWKPPAGSWEDHIAQLDACQDEATGKLMVYLTWKNGHKTQHDTSVVYQRCPQKVNQLLSFRFTDKMKQNDVIAVIIIILFILLAGIAFGIYHLVSVARRNMHGTVTSSSDSSTSEGLTDN
ncbi:hypothetical protein OQA88_9590 [Cercophora sp. LCS_1]